MENDENIENIENTENLKDDAPPVANPQIINNPYNSENIKINQGNPPLNINNVQNNKEDNNFNLLSSFSNINNKNNLPNLQYNNNAYDPLNLRINSNNIQYPQIPNNPLIYNSILYNRINYLQRNYLNLIKSKYKNINPFNNNFNKIESKEYFLTIDYNRTLLRKLDKEDLIELIQFISNFCDITINKDFINYKLKGFSIEKKVKNNKKNNKYVIKINELFINNIKKGKKEDEEDKKEDKNGDEENKKEDKNEDKKDDKKENNINDLNQIIINNDNINNNKINEINIDKLNHNKKDENICYCSNHNKKFISHDAYLSHCMAKHKYLCEKCGLYFGILRKFRIHLLNCKNNNNNENNSNNTNSINNIIDNQKKDELNNFFLNYVYIHFLHLLLKLNYIIRFLYNYQKLLLYLNK